MQLIMLLPSSHVNSIHLERFGTMRSCLTFTICLFPAPIKFLKTSLLGKLRLAPHIPSPGWHVFSLLFLLCGAAIESLKTSLPGKLKLAPHAPSPRKRFNWYSYYYYCCYYYYYY